MKRCLSMLTLFLVSTFFVVGTGWAQNAVTATHHDTSAPLRDMIATANANARVAGQAPYAIPNKFVKSKGQDQTQGNGTPGAQTVMGSSTAATVITQFDGTSDDDNAAVIGFGVVPPDTNGDVGPSHYVQWNNLVAEIFDKTGVSLSGPFAGNAFFAGFGGSCETTNSGDPIVLYDHLADRWLVSQFAVASNNLECVAISTTGDPLGTYNRYSFAFGSDFPDYPKLGVWEDAYYMTTRNFAGGFAYTGIKAVAMERAQMLTGGPAQMVIFDVPGGTQNDGWLPADLDGPAPPAGTPGLFAGAPSTVGSNLIDMWAFSVDWANTANSTFTQVANLPTDPFDTSIFSVPQPSPGESVDAHSGFLMHRLQYRDFGTHKTLILNHTVDVGSNRAGIRWYELRDDGTGWTIYQQGTYAPADGEHRWMGSAAMNGNGDIALGYSLSSTGTNPSIRYTGQTVDQTGTGLMNVAETNIITGAGVQTASSGRWGDYSMMSVDPSDDTTFWYTQEYYANTGSFDFKTRIAHFSLDAGPPPPPQDVTITCTPIGAPIVIGAGGGSFQYDVSIVNNGLASATFDVWIDISGPVARTMGPKNFTVAAGGSIARTLTQTVPGGAPAGTYTQTCSQGTFPVADNSSAFNWDKSVVAPQGNVSSVNSWSSDFADLSAEVATGTTELTLPEAFVLDQNFPNPFGAATQITYALPEGQHVSIKVYNMLGQEVSTLVDDYRAAGRHQVRFDGSQLSAGVYLYVMDAGDFTATKRLTLLK